MKALSRDVMMLSRLQASVPPHDRLWLSPKTMYNKMIDLRILPYKCVVH